MKKLSLVLFFIAFGAGAAEKNRLETDIKFNPLSVQGKYQYTDEALARVEDEKVLEDLLKPRTHFKDRVRKETKRQ